MEVWDIYNIDREKIGKTMTRGSKFNAGEYHMIVSICIFNSRGEMLIQQRQGCKSRWANLWDLTAGGSALAGEISREAARRELKEELGIDIDFKNIKPHITKYYPTSFMDMYLICKDIDISEITMQYEEVQAVKWASIDEVMIMQDKGEFLPHHKILLQLLFDFKTHCFNLKG